MLEISDSPNINTRINTRAKRFCKNKNQITPEDLLALRNLAISGRVRGIGNKSLLELDNFLLEQGLIKTRWFLEGIPFIKDMYALREKRKNIKLHHIAEMSIEDRRRLVYTAGIDEEGEELIFGTEIIAHRGYRRDEIKIETLQSIGIERITSYHTLYQRNPNL